MKAKKLFIILSISFLILSIFQSINSADSEFTKTPFKGSLENSKEVFKFDLSWMGIKAGSATLEFTETTDSATITSRAVSADWISIFYPVDDRAISHIKKVKGDENTIFFKAVKYRLKIKEGRHRRDKEVLFYPERNEAVYINHLDKERKTHRIPDDVLDPLSGFYKLRKKRIDSDPIYIKIFDSKKVWNVKVDVIGRETIETEAGRFKTIVVKPDLKSEGIFNRKGEILIYLTDDDRHIPVLLKTKVLIGYVEAELVGGKF